MTRLGRHATVVARVARVARVVALVVTSAHPVGAHETPTLALHVDVSRTGEVVLQQLAGPRTLVALDAPRGCEPIGDTRTTRVDTARDLPARFRCSESGLRGAWVATGLGSHAQALAVRAEGATRGTWTVLAASPSFTLVSAKSEVSGSSESFDALPAIAAGASHVAHGLDHLAIVALLVVRAPGLLAALVPLLGFTLAHAVTLGLAALGHPIMPARLAEILVAVSIVLATRLEPEETLARRSTTAATFGLVHGVAFLEGAAPLLLHGHAPLATLAAFHAGIEVVQVAAALAIAVLLAAAQTREGFAQRLRSSVVTLAGAYGVALVFARLAGAFGVR